MPAAREPVSATRRAMFAGAALIAGAAALPAVAAPSHIEALSAALSQYDAWTDRMNAATAANPNDEDEWDRWADEGTALYKAIERLPRTAETARLKARTINSILEGRLDEELNEQGTTVERLLVQIIRTLASGV